VAALAEWGASAAREGLRAVPPESLHVTLAFLGERPEEEVAAIGAALHEAAAPVPRLAVGAPTWLPPRQPRVLAVDLEDPGGACSRLQGAVSAALVDLGAFTPERRPFRPHVTVARVRKGHRVDTALPALSRRPTFAASALTLYRSRLSPKGASYHALERVALP
jgi:2'-5' RNA ligase